MLSRKQLIDDIDRVKVPFGNYALWWLGQHSFIVKLGKKILYLDAFLSPLPNRQVPPLLKPEEIRHADFFFGSHDHADHIDRDIWPNLARASVKAKFIVPELLRENLSQELKISEDRLVGLDDLQNCGN